MDSIVAQTFPHAQGLYANLEQYRFSHREQGLECLQIQSHPLMAEAIL